MFFPDGKKVSQKSNSQSEECLECTVYQGSLGGVRVRRGCCLNCYVYQRSLTGALALLSKDELEVEGTRVPTSYEAIEKLTGFKKKYLVDELVSRIVPYVGGEVFTYEEFMSYRKAPNRIVPVAAYIDVSGVDDPEAEEARQLKATQDFACSHGLVMIDSFIVRTDEDLDSQRINLRAAVAFDEIEVVMVYGKALPFGLRSVVLDIREVGQYGSYP